MIKQDTIERLDEANVCNMYSSGMTMNEIISNLHVGYFQLHQYLMLRGIPRRKAKRRQSIRPLAPIGKTFGLWTVISDETKAGREINKVTGNRGLYWLMKCKCGGIGWRSAGSILRGVSTRCKKCGNKLMFSRDGEVEISAVILSKFNQILNSIKLRKKVRSLNFNLTPEYLNKLYNDSKYCSLSGLDISIDLSKTVQEQDISVDRIDSNKGYEIENVQLLDKRINMMKGSLSNEEFIYLCKLVAEKHS
jgi:hypothetical protein